MENVLAQKLELLLREAKKDCKSGEVVELELVIEAYNQLNLDSKRWQAFIHSPFRLFGYAGLNHDNPQLPDEGKGFNGYAHFGCEMWTNHSGWKDGAGKDILIGFADQAIKLQILSK